MPTEPRQLSEYDKEKIKNSPKIILGTIIWILCFYGIYCLIFK